MRFGAARSLHQLEVAFAAIAVARARLGVAGGDIVFVLSEHHALTIFLGINRQHGFQGYLDLVAAPGKTRIEPQPVVGHLQIVHGRLVDIQNHLAFLHSLLGNIDTLNSGVHQNVRCHSIVSNPFVQCAQKIGTV